jgi:hypothetical protein
VDSSGTFLDQMKGFAVGAVKPSSFPGSVFSLVK